MAEMTFNLTVKELDFSEFTLVSSKTTRSVVALAISLGVNKPPMYLEEKYFEIFDRKDFEFN